MSSSTLVPFTEAAVFTLGCALIASRRIDPQRLGAVLGLATVTLAVLLVVFALPGSPQMTLADPDGVRNFLN
jgi:FtsH-binding integral membrane protein